MRVCIIPAGTGGVAFYRVLQPYGWLKDHGEEIFIFDKNRHDAQRLQIEQQHADIIVYQCPWSEGILEAAKVIKAGKEFGKNKKIVVELDDNLFDVDPWNEKYNMFGIQEHKIIVDSNDIATEKRFIDGTKGSSWIRQERLKDGRLSFDMWRDGHRGFSIEENERKYKATAQLLNMVDMITVTTKELGKQIRKIAPDTKIMVLPNLVDPDRFLPMKKKDDGFLRVGWQGGSAHFDDLRLVIDPIKKIYNKHKNVKFVLKGVQFDSIFEDVKDRVEWEPWHGDIATYPLDVRDMGLDIGLAPLQDTTFNRGKSPIKWIEYSQMGVPSVCSEIVYGPYIDNRKTGFTAVTPDQWFNCIDKLICDEELRNLIAKKAKVRVEKKWQVDKSVLWGAALRDIL
jgi:hypothetical protein